MWVVERHLEMAQPTTTKKLLFSAEHFEEDHVKDHSTDISGSSKSSNGSIGIGFDALLASMKSSHSNPEPEVGVSLWTEMSKKVGAVATSNRSRRRRRRRVRRSCRTKSYLGTFVSFLFLNMGQSRPLFHLFLSFPHSNFIYNFNNTNWKSMYGVLGIRTLGSRMVGAEQTMELWLPPRFLSIPRLEVCRRTSLNLTDSSFMENSVPRIAYFMKLMLM